MLSPHSRTSAPSLWAMRRAARESAHTGEPLIRLVPCPNIAHAIARCMALFEAGARMLPLTTAECTVRVSMHYSSVAGYTMSARHSSSARRVADFHRQVITHAEHTKKSGLRLKTAPYRLMKKISTLRRPTRLHRTIHPISGYLTPTPARSLHLLPS